MLIGAVKKRKVPRNCESYSNRGGRFYGEKKSDTTGYSYGNFRKF